MPTVQRFEDLQVWQEARELVKCVYPGIGQISQSRDLWLDQPDAPCGSFGNGKYRGGL